MNSGAMIESCSRRVVNVNERALTVFENDTDKEPRVLDVDLAVWLEFSRPRDIRKVIKRYVESGEIKPMEQRDTVSRCSRGGRPMGVVQHTQYWLNEADALFIAAKSETPKANALLHQIIATFIQVRRILAEQSTIQAHAPANTNASSQPAVAIDLFRRVGPFAYRDLADCDKLIEAARSSFRDIPDWCWGRVKNAINPFQAELTISKLGGLARLFLLYDSVPVC